MREFRASRAYKDEKDEYASAFIKYGFYQARGYLECKRPGETFPELVYGPEAEEFVPKDWREFDDPDSTPPTEYLKGDPPVL